MLRTAQVYLFDTVPVGDDTFVIIRGIRRARLYPIGVQKPTRSRQFYFDTAPAYVTDDPTEFVIRARRRKPMDHPAVTETWPDRSSPSNSWVDDSTPANTWTERTDPTNTWTEH